MGIGKFRSDGMGRWTFGGMGVRVRVRVTKREEENHEGDDKEGFYM